jgi:hypothetical protein
MTDVIKFGEPAPSKESLLEDAKKVPPPVSYKPLYEYGEVIDVLRQEKNLSWPEVRKWFYERGMDYTSAHFCNAYQKWKVLNGIFEK